MFHAAMERHPCQRNGLVVLRDMRKIGRNFAAFTAHRKAAGQIVDCVPVRIRVFHCLFGNRNLVWRTVLQGLSSLFFLALKRRFVMHVRSMEETVEELRVTYGIKADNLPVCLGGTVEYEYSVRWLEQRRRAGG
mmetsp:Transcript_10764/g.31865  ORF Transcript_10764/g.31865 Transcript_10764/m.31865 type:complete len:134 (-) Transcript_10764:50-451(-)